MIDATPELYLRTGFVLDEARRILRTREPGAQPGPLFTLVRATGAYAAAVHASVPDATARELERLAGTEPLTADLRATPRNAERYVALLRAHRGSSEALPRATSGPAFAFPDTLPAPAGVVEVHDERVLQPSFSGWTEGEIAAGRAPLMAIVQDGHPVSVCFCARRSADAAEAGLETAEGYRGRGLAAHVTAAWANAVRAEGLTPLYSTFWSNAHSLAVARKLGLRAYASTWSLVG